MKSKNLYLVLAALGAILPLAVFYPWVAQNGLNILLLAEQIQASPVAAFGWLDVFFAAVVLLVWIYFDNRRPKAVFAWIVALATLMIGPSLGLPLYLYWRQI